MTNPLWDKDNAQTKENCKHCAPEKPPPQERAKPRKEILLRPNRRVADVKVTQSSLVSDYEPLRQMGKDEFFVTVCRRFEIVGVTDDRKQHLRLVMPGECTANTQGEVKHHEFTAVEDNPTR